MINNIFRKIIEHLKNLLSYLDIEVIKRCRYLMLNITKGIACLFLLYLLLWHNNVTINLLPFLHNVLFVGTIVKKVESLGTALLLIPLGLIIMSVFYTKPLLKNFTSLLALQCTWLRVTRTLKSIDSFKEFSLLGIIRITEQEPDMYLLYFFILCLLLLLSFLAFIIYFVYFKK